MSYGNNPIVSPTSQRLRFDQREPAGSGEANGGKTEELHNRHEEKRRTLGALVNPGVLNIELRRLNYQTLGRRFKNTALIQEHGILASPRLEPLTEPPIFSCVAPLAALLDAEIQQEPLHSHPGRIAPAMSPPQCHPRTTLRTDRKRNPSVGFPRFDTGRGLDDPLTLKSNNSITSRFGMPMFAGFPW